MLKINFKKTFIKRKYSNVNMQSLTNFFMSIWQPYTFKDAWRLWSAILSCLFSELWVVVQRADSHQRAEDTKKEAPKRHFTPLLLIMGPPRSKSSRLLSERRGELNWFVNLSWHGSGGLVGLFWLKSENNSRSKEKAAGHYSAPHDRF